MATNFPGALDTYSTLVDNTDTVVAAHPNDRGDAIEQLEIKVGVDSSAVVATHDYKLRNLPAQDGDWDAGAVEVRAQTLESDVATGTAPLTIASSTVVSNLNADKLDGQEGSYYTDIANASISGNVQGDILYYTGSAWARLAAGTANQLLKTGGAGANPSWATAGIMVKYTYTQSGSVATGNTALPYDDTIPQITEGDQFMTLAITPTSATNVLKIDVVWAGAISDATNITVALFQDSTANALAWTCEHPEGSGNLTNLKFSYSMVAGTTSSTTFRVRAGGASGITTFNGASGVRKFGGAIASSISIMEILV